MPDGGAESLQRDSTADRRTAAQGKTAEASAKADALAAAAGSRHARSALLPPRRMRPRASATAPGPSTRRSSRRNPAIRRRCSTWRGSICRIARSMRPRSACGPCLPSIRRICAAAARHGGGRAHRRGCEGCRAMDASCRRGSCRFAARDARRHAVLSLEAATTVRPSRPRRRRSVLARAGQCRGAQHARSRATRPGEPQAAIASLQEAVQKAPQSTGYRLNLGRALALQRDTDGALDAFDGALKIDAELAARAVPGRDDCVAGRERSSARPATSSACGRSRRRAGDHAYRGRSCDGAEALRRCRRRYYDKALAGGGDTLLVGARYRAGRWPERANRRRCCRTGSPRGPRTRRRASCWPSITSRPGNVAKAMREYEDVLERAPQQRSRAQQPGGDRAAATAIRARSIWRAAPTRRRRTAPRSRTRTAGC